MSTKKSDSKKVSKKNDKVNVLNEVRNELQEEFRQNSIFLQMEEGKPIAAIITGFALRIQEFKKGESQVIDMRLQTVEDCRTLVASVPRFSKVAFQSAINIATNNGVVIRSIVPDGIRPNLRGDYPWVTTEIPAVFKPNTFNDKVWIGKIMEVPKDLAPAEEDANLLDQLIEEVKEVA